MPPIKVEENMKWTNVVICKFISVGAVYEECLVKETRTVKVNERIKCDKTGDKLEWKECRTERKVCSRGWYQMSRSLPPPFDSIHRKDWKIWMRVKIKMCCKLFIDEPKARLFFSCIFVSFPNVQLVHWLTITLFWISTVQLYRNNLLALKKDEWTQTYQ